MSDFFDRMVAVDAGPTLAPRALSRFERPDAPEPLPTEPELEVPAAREDEATTTRAPTRHATRHEPTPVATQSSSKLTIEVPAPTIEPARPSLDAAPVAATPSPRKVNERVVTMTPALPRHETRLVSQPVERHVSHTETIARETTLVREVQAAPDLRPAAELTVAAQPPARDDAPEREAVLVPRPAPPMQRVEHAAPATATAPTIKIAIGRIEVRAVAPPIAQPARPSAAPTPSARPSPSPSTLSLARYLEARRRGEM